VAIVQFAERLAVALSDTIEQQYVVTRLVHILHGGGTGSRNDNTSGVRRKQGGEREEAEGAEEIFTHAAVGGPTNGIRMLVHAVANPSCLSDLRPLWLCVRPPLRALPPRAPLAPHRRPMM
jgi:hypothetical protein